MNTTESIFVRRLAWQAVQHACGHYEARLMRPYAALVVAGSPCSTCAPQGRPVQTQYLTMASADEACHLLNLDESR